MADELTSVTIVKSWLNITNASEDVLLQEIIDGVVAAFQEELGRAIISAAKSETIDGKGTFATPLQHWPVTAVAALTVDGVTVPAAVDSQGSGYMIAQNEQGLDYVGTIRGFSRGQRNIVVAYTGGYTADTMPKQLKSAASKQSVYEYKGRGWTGEKSKQLGAGQVVSYETAAFLPSVQRVLDTLQRVY